MFQYEDVSVKEVSQAVAVQQFYGIVAGSLNSVRKFMERVPSFYILDDGATDPLIE